MSKVFCKIIKLRSHFKLKVLLPKLHITAKRVDYCCIIHDFMTLANLKEFVCKKILYFMIVDIHKMHAIEINIKS